jgi:hypothetical protein
MRCLRSSTSYGQKIETVEKTVNCPFPALRELEELATLAAGANWGMEFAGTAMHFRFHLQEDATKFITATACKYPVSLSGTRRWIRRDP